MAKGVVAFSHLSQINCIVDKAMSSQANPAGVNQPDVVDALTFGALVLSAVVAPLVALLLHALFPVVPWLTWDTAIWMIPSWLVACTLIAGALMLPIAGFSWILSHLIQGIHPSTKVSPGSRLVSQAGILATLVFWLGAGAGGSIYVVWKAARHSFLAY